MYMAGYLEGYLTQRHIYNAYHNFVDSVLNGNEKISEKAEKFISENLKWIETQIITYRNDNFWILVDGLMQQLKGMYDGYIRKINDEKKKEEYLSFFNFYYLTNMGDLEDIIPAFEVDHG
jgi:hypothetical protein